MLRDFNVPHECRIVSAHRTPDLMNEYATQAAGRGLEVIIAGAGGAAHLPGMVAGHTLLPVIGVPIQSRALNGLDSLLSIVQMPAGVPVATMAIWPCRCNQCRAPCYRHTRRNASRFTRSTRTLPRRTCHPSHIRNIDIGRIRLNLCQQNIRIQPILPGATIGVFGSGQLGRMMALAAPRHGLSHPYLLTRS